MWSAFDISAAGLANSVANLSNAASRVAKVFTGGSAPNTPQSQPAPSASTATAPVANPPVSVANAIAAQEQGNNDPASWMVEILKAKAAYRANAAVMKTAEKMDQTTLDIIS